MAAITPRRAKHDSASVSAELFTHPAQRNQFRDEATLWRAAAKALGEGNR